MEKITNKIAALPKEASYFSLEFFPPKTTEGLSNLQTRLDRMARGLRPLFVTVTWGAGGSTATRSLELAEICQKQLGLTTCLHLTCTNMSASLVHEALEEAKSLGVRNILALRGDPPRQDEYFDRVQASKHEEDQEFVWAVDLVKYIRKHYGDYFCIGVAAYPEGHSDESYPQEQDPARDMPFLRQKVEAGADFIMTQLFYEVASYEKFELLLRNDVSGLFKEIPVIPGLMPIQSFQILKRTTKLSHAKLPPDILRKVEEVKTDDEAVKRTGVAVVSEIVRRIRTTPSPGPRGFHFYTLNLEKAVAFILQQCKLIPALTPELRPTDSVAVEETNDRLPAKAVNGSMINGGGAIAHRDRRRSSRRSETHNQVIVESGTLPSDFAADADEAGLPREKVASRAANVAISEGEGSLGREATWDDFPNGRWGDARSPAYGEIDGYGVSLHVSINQATKLWGFPVTREDISHTFTRYLSGELSAIPWSEERLNDETATITSRLLPLNKKGWWTVASQPAVNGVRSNDTIFGWGPRNGFVFQKAFVEFFIPASDWKILRTKLVSFGEEMSYFAGNASGEFETSNAEAVNAVTWGCFPGKEIITPTIIEPLSFRAWLDEAFDIWTEWARIYPARSASSKLLKEIKEDYWLVNVVHHGYVEADTLWEVLST